MSRVSVGLLLIFCLFCARVDNAVYTRGQLIQTRSISYFTSLVTAIRSTPGYTGSTPVAFVGDPSYAMDPTFRSTEEFGALSMAPLPYDASPFSIGYSWQDFLTLWCGFTPPYADGEDFANLPEVQAIPGFYLQSTYNVIGYVKTNLSTTTIYDDYYVMPSDVDITAGEKRNLLCIYLESMEITYADEAHGGANTQNYIPYLTDLALNNTSFGSSAAVLGGVQNLPNTAWTSAALIASTSGIPFNFPITHFAGRAGV